MYIFYSNHFVLFCCCLLFVEGTLPVPIFEKSCVIKQLSVVEDHGVLVLRMDKGKDCRIFVFYLKDFDNEPTAFYTKSDCKDHKLEGTKGCHFFALNRPGGAFLRMAVAMTKKIIIMQVHFLQASKKRTNYF